MAARSLDTQPIAALNVTPLIDVLLVLLIMMIMTIPTMTHKVAIDLPQSTPSALDPGPKHRLDIAASGALTLDGTAIAETALPDQLVAIGAQKDALLSVSTDPAAHYETFDRVLATIKRSGITRLGFVGNERFARAF